MTLTQFLDQMAVQYDDWDEFIEWVESRVYNEQQAEIEAAAVY